MEVQKSTLRGILKNNPHSIWNSIKTMTEYKNSTTQISDDAAVPDNLNQSFACFDYQNNTVGAQMAPYKAWQCTSPTAAPGDENSHQKRSQTAYWKFVLISRGV